MRFANIPTSGVLGIAKKEKGLLLYGWVIMSNQVHLILRSDKENLSDIIWEVEEYI